MAKVLSRDDFYADLRARIAEHAGQVTTVFAELDDARLAWRPNPREWSILHCFDHLNLTFDYYRPKLVNALARPVPVGGRDVYQASGWGGFYMFFSLNPRFSFPTAAQITPDPTPERSAFVAYLARQEELLRFLADARRADLSQTPIPVEKGIRFNLGDVFRFLVYHDEVHFMQARRVLAVQSAASPAR